MNNSFWSNKEILITGGTGSLGKVLTKTIMKNCNVKGIRIFSRDELKQWEFRNELEYLVEKKELLPIPISFLIGDIRDKDRITLAMRNTDIVIHTAAMKQIPACEYNPMEAVMTNIIGTQNVLTAALKTKPEKVILISTDKANTPLNLYGATKMTAEKLFLFGNIYTAGRLPIFSCVRYGNVLGSRGSVIPLFKKQIEKNSSISLTSSSMTRFWISLDKVANFIIDRIQDMKGAEIFIPKMPSSYVIDIVNAIIRNKKMKISEIKTNIIGLREGEKLHETLINKEESPYVVEFKNYYIITRDQQITLPFSYSSNKENNFNFLNENDVYNLLIESGELKNNAKCSIF